MIQRHSLIATVSRENRDEGIIRSQEHRLSERDRRRAHRLIHRCQRGLRTKTDALIGRMDLTLGCKGS